MNLNLYLNKETRFHRLDPRTRLFCLILTIGLLLCFNHPLFVGSVLLFILLLTAISGVIERVWQLRWLSLIVMLIPMLTWPLYLKTSTPLWSWWIFDIYQEALVYSLGMSLRLVGVLMTGLVFLSTMRPEEFHAVLVLMKVPYPLAFTFSLASRLVQTYLGVAVGIIEAQTSRGLDLSSGSLPSRLGKYMALTIPLFIYATRQADQLAIALESRGFAPHGKRTYYWQYRMQRIDWVVMFSFGLLFIGGLVLRFQGIGAVLPGRL